MSPAALALSLLAAYLLGALPTAYIAGRWLRGLDIRQHGSGNVGATNVFRVLGKGPGAAVLALDMAKGALAAALLPRLAAPAAGAAAAWWPCALGLAAVLGHSYTVFLGFKGGKGVATSAGVFLGLAPLATLACLALFLAVLLPSRMVSAGSLAAAAALPLLVRAFGEGGAAAPGLPGPVQGLSLALAALVWLKHIPNIRRILAGTENRFGRPRAGEGR